MNFIKKKIAKPLKDVLLGKSPSSSNLKPTRTYSDTTLSTKSSQASSSTKSSFAKAVQQKPNSWSARYCTGVDEIDGYLTINEDSLVFTPTVNSPTSYRPNESPSSNTLEGPIRTFEAIISINDITEINVSEFPYFHITDKNKRDNVYILQVSLSNHGDFQFEGEAHEAMKEVREAKKPYVAVFFNIEVEGSLDPNEPDRKSVLLSQIKQQTDAIKELNSHKNYQSNVRTRLPYFEFIPNEFDERHNKALKEAKQQIKENSLNIEKQQREANSRIKINVSQAHFSFEESKTKPLTVIPVRKKKPIIQATMKDESDIVDYARFCQIVTCVPDFYQMSDWKLAYSNKKHGTSFSNLMRRCQDANPFVIIIKDLSGNVFGAYGSDRIKYTPGYYGSGETFVYSFHGGQQEITQYNWSKKNDFFIFFNEDGLMFGTGPFYGLWISNDLTRGRTYACDTFDSQPLTTETDFEISRIEVWTIPSFMM